MTHVVSALGPRDVYALLTSDDGLRLRMGPFVAAIRTPLRQVADAVCALYGSYPIATPDEFTDFSVSVKRPMTWRRFFEPQVTFGIDGQEPFNPLPGDQGFPLLEWGLNWCVYGSCHQYLILHAAILERNGQALILPAPSGSGKSTLCAGLLFHGWRLLSDELTLICPQQHNLVPNPRPVSLKNQSIEVITHLVPSVRFGSRVSETVKGVVAHFPAPAEAVERAAERALPGWIVLPKYRAGAPTLLQPLERARTLMHLVENCFNYDLFGQAGFELLADVIGRSQCFSFEYSSLPEAMALFDRLAQGQPTTRD